MNMAFILSLCAWLSRWAEGISTIILKTGNDVLLTDHFCKSSRQLGMDVLDTRNRYHKGVAKVHLAC